jgi:hypothetical protein
MKFLFWVFALLGLITYDGGRLARTAPSPATSRRAAAQQAQRAPVDVVTISEDGTPPPRK